MKVEEAIKSLQEGVQKIFTSGEYQRFLDMMSKFHQYSYSNAILIYMQKPEATLVAGYQAWSRKFGRHVKKGEKGIRIIAPIKIKNKEKEDEETEKKEIVRFRVTTVFDLSQTEGNPLPSLGVDELQGKVTDFSDLQKVLIAISPVPIRFEEVLGGAKGYYSLDQRYIAIQSGMSEVQTVKTCIHEISHAMLHADRDCKKDRSQREVEAESTAYVVCNSLGIDTSDYSFGYVAGWSSGKETKELCSSLDTIRKTAGEIIKNIKMRYNR